MIFSMNTEPVPTESQVIYQQVLASFHRAKTWQLSITFPAWFSAALPIPCIYTHVCLGRYTLWTSWYSANTDHQPGWRYTSQYTIWNFIRIFLYMVDKSFILIIAFSDSQQGTMYLPWAVCLPCTSPAGSRPRLPRVCWPTSSTAGTLHQHRMSYTTWEAGSVHADGVT